MSDLWNEYKGKDVITEFDTEAWRIESQALTGMRKLVDSLEEQALLEELIEADKPGFQTPFRNPPLEYGSRFGKRLDPSLWYGSFAIETAMAEKAFYTFNFLRASFAFNDLIVEIPLTVFSTHIKTHRGVKLDAPPFNEHTRRISAPDSYEISQELGAAMRNANIEAFTYQSARDPNGGTNIALFTPNAFQNKKPISKSFQSWQCVANHELVEFVRSNAISTESHSFPLDLFLLGQMLPFPAL